MVKSSNFLYRLFFTLLCFSPINGQELGTDEYLIAKDTLIEDLYKRVRVKRSNVCICPEERDLTFTKSENSAFDNAVLIEEAANSRLHAWYDRQKTRIKEHLERRYNKSFANFDEAKNELFLNCERANIKRNAIPIIRKYRDLKSHRFFAQNTYLKELKLLKLRKIEIASGNFNSPKFGYLKVKGTRLKDIMDITVIDDLWEIRYNDFAKNNVITSRHHKTFKNLQTIEADPSFTNKIIDSKNHYFNHLSPYNQLNYIQFLMNNESLHASRNVLGYPSKISSTFHEYQKGNIATSPFIEEYAIKKSEKAVFIFDNINKHTDFLGFWGGERERQKFIDLIKNRQNALKNLLSNVNMEHLAIENLKNQLNITEGRHAKWLYTHQEEAQQITDYLKVKIPTISNAKERRRLFINPIANREDFNNLFKDVKLFFKEKEERTHFVEDFLKTTDEIENASFRHYLNLSRLVSPNHQEINNDTFSEDAAAWYGSGSSIALEEGKLKVQSIPLWSSVRKRLPQKVTAGSQIVGSVFVDLRNTKALGIGVSKYNGDNYLGIDNITDFTQGWNTFEYAVPEGVNTLDFKIFKNVNDGLETSYAIDNFKLSLNDISTDTERKNLSIIKLMKELDITSSTQEMWLYSHEEDAQIIIDLLDKNRVNGHSKAEYRDIAKRSLDSFKDGFEQDYMDKMSASEIIIYNSISRHKQISYLINAQAAIWKAEALFPNSLRNGKGDAFRHAFFNAVNSITLGLNLAERLATAHENKPIDPNYRNHYKENQMDLFNNQIGRDRRNWLTDGYWSLEESILNALTNGKLRYLSNLVGGLSSGRATDQSQLIPTN